MILVRGISAGGGTLAQLVPDLSSAERFIATIEDTSAHSIAWSLSTTTSHTVNDACATIPTTPTTTSETTT